MHLSKTIGSIAATLLLALPFTLAATNSTDSVLNAAGNWTATDGSGVQAAPGFFTFILTNAKDDTNNGGLATIQLWTESIPGGQSQTITMCGADPLPIWEGFKFVSPPFPIGLHYSAKWCKESNSDGLWLSYFDSFQMDVSTSGVCEEFGSNLSWQCWLSEGSTFC